MPRDNNLWVFGAWYGLKYSDNSRFFFEYILQNHPSIKIIWLTRDVKIRNKLRKEGKKVELTTSFKAIYYSLRAEIIIFSSGLADVNKFFINGAKIVHLWHGSPFKKIGLDDEFAVSKYKNTIIRIFFPFIWEYRIDYVINTADIFNDKLSSAFGISSDSVLCCGFPRNDLLFSNRKDKLIDELNIKFSYPKIVLYLPTFRNISEKFKPFRLYGFDEIKWNDFLEANNIVFVSKGHFIDNEVGEETRSSRIIHLSDKDIDELYLFLKDIHILITDYSSVFYDFLLINRPIIFAPFDIESYISKSRRMYFNYQDVVCGPIAKDWTEVMFAVKEVLKNDLYINKRNEKNILFNKYHDSHNSERLFNLIRSLVQ